MKLANERQSDGVIFTIYNSSRVHGFIYVYIYIHYFVTLRVVSGRPGGFVVKIACA